MRKPMFALFVLAIALFGTQCWGAICSNPPPSTITAPTTTVVSCTNQFSPTVTTATFDFRSTGDGIIKLTFVTVLTTFNLTATVNHTIDPFDPNEFPVGTVAVTYGNGNKDQYDFTGNAGGPNGVPVRGTDYTGMITIELTYTVGQTVHTPAFAHAPGDATTFNEAIPLRGYFQPAFTDPTMCGDVPGLSSIAAADEPFSVTGNIFCSLTLTPTNVPSGQKPQIEVIFKIVGSGSSCTGTGVRDKTAKLYVSTVDSSGRSFPALKNVEGNKFHWIPNDALNEYDISTETLVTGQTYTVTVISELVSPQSANFTAP